MTTAQFAKPWWFRTDFTASLATGQTASLVVNGVVGKADVWLDGKEIATSATVTGAYTKFTFDVSGVLRAGTNSLAIEMYPNDPSTMLTLDDVDWNQLPPDNNTGIQFPVQLLVANALSIGNAHVIQANAADMSSSKLTVKADVTNGSGVSQTGDRHRHHHSPIRRRADHREPGRHGRGARHGHRHLPGADDLAPAGLVAVPDGPVAAVHIGHERQRRQ